MDTNDFFTEGTRKTASGRVPDRRCLPLRRMPGTERYPGDRCTGRSCCCQSSRTAGKRQTDHQPVYSRINPLFCNGCASCEKVCPYGAISYEDRQVNDHGIRETRHVAVVNGALCHGCGACTVACPSGAMDLKGFSNRQILAEVDAICR